MEAPLGMTEVKLKVSKRCFESFNRAFRNNIHPSRIERYEPVEDMFTDMVNVTVWSNDITALKVLSGIQGAGCTMPEIEKELKKRKYANAAKPLNIPKPKAAKKVTVRKSKPKATPKPTPKPKPMAKKRRSVSPLKRMQRAARLLVKPTGIKADGTLKKGYTRLKNGDVVKKTLVKKCPTTPKKTVRKSTKRK
jgi:hypothetical protein